MKNTNSSDKKRVTQILLVSGLLLAGYQNCAPSSSGTASLSSVKGPTITVIDDPDHPTEVVDTKAFSVTNSENILITMQGQTGVKTVSARTKTAAANQLSMIPETGAADSVTAPMWIAVTNLAGEMCQDLVTEEKAATADARRIFGQIDFNVGPNMQTVDAKNDMVRRMARSFWGRNETDGERQAILAGIDESFGSVTTVAQTENAMIYACAGMLASFDAQKQ